MTTEVFRPVPPRGEPGKPGYVPEWQRVFANGFAPQLGLAGLRALRDGLIANDPNLIQGKTCRPTPAQADGYPDARVFAACAIGYGLWFGHDKNLVLEIEEGFGKACYDCDKIMGEPCSTRHFLNWFDDTPREEMIAALLPVVRRLISVYEQTGFDPQAAPQEAVAAC